MMEDELVVFGTSLGWMGLACRGQAVVRVVLGHRGPGEAWRALAGGQGKHTQRLGLPDQARAMSHAAATAAERLQAYAAGEVVDLSQLPVQLAGRSFQRRVWRACRAIQYGETVSYGELARRAGAAGAARAVGGAMAANRVPLLVPCHRVIAASGNLGGFSAPGGLATKRHLLELETRGMGAPPRRLDSLLAAR